ncbi:peptidase M15-like protein [Acinetobacter calcoaceticus]|uniref:Peptidase M15-like protein n=1 Tax=Acinetobacter calcoaceticus TaxID=471 RepID=A0A4R1XNY0_ACICA|nr:peptidase M15-like protein [Acinetobacter calcoaceticus]
MSIDLSNTDAKPQSIMRSPWMVAVLILCTAILASCKPTSKKVQLPEDPHYPVDAKTLKQFEQWKAQQNPAQLAKYQAYVAERIDQPLSLYALSFNGHRTPAQCEHLRFSIPPEQQWSHIIPSLKLIERLQAQGLFKHYQIISTYRSAEMNDCIKGAKRSKHVHNHAVDFKALDENWKPYRQSAYLQLQQQMCQFWSESGAKAKMGLGVYPSRSFHIDTQGHRTWGGDYQRKSSPCILAQ